ncbi:MAG: prepilin peptidase, partial [Chthoniobacteraceae bacterium]
MLPYESVFAIFAFLLGACIGSFLNVCIYRLPLDLSVNEPRRSFCPSCKYQIPWHRNLPLISWLSLRGKCANCGAPIAFRYFGVELLTGLLFLAVWLHVWPGNPVFALPLWVMVALLVVATFIDFEHFIIPDEITWGGAIAGVMLNCLLAPLTFPFGDFGQWFASLSALALIGGGVLLGSAMGGPIKAMRVPWKFFTCALTGAAVALLVESLLGGWTSFSATLSSLIGAATGYFLLWGVVEAGKLAFGKKKIAFDQATAFTWTRRGDEADFGVGDEKQLWSDMFAREKDRLLMKCPEATIQGDRFKDVTLEFHYDRLRIGDREWKLITLDELTGTVTEIVIPREAMGFGDVKFMACIGAFIGWKGVIFTLIAASMVGAFIGLATIALGKREWSAKIPFGPYLSLGALVWIFAGPQLVAWYLTFTQGGYNGAP